MQSENAWTQHFKSAMCPTVATVCILLATLLSELITFQNNTAGPTYSAFIVCLMDNNSLHN